MLRGAGERREYGAPAGGWDAPAPAVRTRSARLLEEVRAGELSLAASSHGSARLQPHLPPLDNRVGHSGRGTQASWRGATAPGATGQQAPLPSARSTHTPLRSNGLSGSNGPSAALDDPFANTRFHAAQRQRAELLRSRAFRASSVRWSPVPAAALGFATAYVAVLVGAAACDCDGGTMAGVAAAFVLAACLAAAALALQGWRCVAFAWAAGGLVAGVAPACLAAASQLGALRLDAAEAALAAAPAAGVPFAQLNVSAAVLGADAPLAQVFLVRDVVARLDLLGEGVSYWPLEPAGRAATPVSWAARGVTPGAAAAVGTFCVAPLVPAAWPATWGAPGDSPPPAWAACHNGFAGEASCAAALQRTYAAADAIAHAPLADCLRRLGTALAPSNDTAAVPAADVARPPVVLALPSAGLLEMPWIGDSAALAAPAVRRAALSYGLRIAPEEYDRAVIFGFIGTGRDACCAARREAAARTAGGAAAAVLSVLLMAAALAAERDGYAARRSAAAAIAAARAQPPPSARLRSMAQLARRVAAMPTVAALSLRRLLRPPRTRRAAFELDAAQDAVRRAAGLAPLRRL